MKKKVAYMIIAILVLFISVIRVFGEPDKNPFETQPATHLVGIALLSSFVSVGCVSANTISSPPVEVLARRIMVSDFRRDYVKSYTKMIRNTRGHMVPVTFSNGVKVGVQYMYFGYMYDEDYGVTNIVVDK